jgi:hypothetical protein
MELAALDAQAGNGVGEADTPGIALVDVVQERSVPPEERKRVQKQPDEQGQVLIEEHFLESPGFLEHMELPQTVEFPGLWVPVAEIATAPALPAFLAKVNQAVQHHSHQ